MPTVTAYPTVETDLHTGINAWINPSRITAADGSKATYTTAGSSTDTGTLEGSSLGFDSLIPAGATITGVFLEYNANGDPANAGRIAALGMAYVLGGTVGSYHDIAGTSTTAADYVIDVTADRSWTRSDLLNSNLKFRIHIVRNGGGSSNATGSFDYARIRVTYTVAAQTVSPSGITSGGAFGTPVITVGPATVSPSGIASAGALGTPTITPGGVTVSPSGIASAEAFGTPVVSGFGTIAPAGIPSAEAFGTPTVTPGGVTLDPSGIPTGEALGTPVVSSSATISPSGVASDGAFGTPTVTRLSGTPTASPHGGLEWHLTGLWYPDATSVDYFGRIADPIDGEVTIPLNDSRQAEVTVSLHDPMVTSLIGHTYARCLRAYYRGRLVFWGPVKIADVDMEAETVKFTAVDPSLRMISHYLRRGDLNGALSASNNDQGTVSIDHIGLRLLRDAANNIPEQPARGVPDLGLIDGANDFVAAPTDLMGVHRGDQVWNAMLQLCASLGPDFELEPIQDTAGAYAKLNTYRQQGQAREATVKWHYGTGYDNLAGLSFTEGTKYITHAHVLDRALIYRVTVAEIDESALTGPYVEWDATDYDATGVPEADAERVLRAYGTDVIDAYGSPLVTCELKLPVETGADDEYHYLEDYAIGDTVEVAGRVGAIELRAGVHRITQVRLVQSGPENSVAPEVTVVPSVTLTVTETDE
ncbi:MAG: hypothetical protein ACXVHX_22715 [Solirubrobacteraceae bacterium]